MTGTRRGTPRCSSRTPGCSWRATCSPTSRSRSWTPTRAIRWGTTGPGLRRLAAVPGVRWLVPGHGHVAGAAEFRRRLDADARYLDLLAAGEPFDDPRCTLAVAARLAPAAAAARRGAHRGRPGLRPRRLPEVTRGATCAHAGVTPGRGYGARPVGQVVAGRWRGRRRWREPGPARRGARARGSLAGTALSGLARPGRDGGVRGGRPGAAAGPAWSSGKGAPRWWGRPGRWRRRAGWRARR